MRLMASLKQVARRSWDRAVLFCEAKEKLEAAHQKAREAADSVVVAKQASEKELSDVRTQSEFDIENANREKANADLVAEGKQAELNELMNRIDAASMPIVKDLIAKERRKSQSDIRKAKREKGKAESWSEKLRKQINLFEGEDSELTFTEMDDLRNRFEEQYFNTYRKLHVIDKTIDGWVGELREQYDESRAFLDSVPTNLI